MKLFYSIIICTLSITVIANSQGWRKLYLPEVDSTARIIQFADSLNGWVLAEKQLFITKDGGSSWERNTYPNKQILLQGKMTGYQSGLIILSDKNPKYNDIQPLVYYYTHQGKSWKEVFKMKHDIIYYFSAIVEKAYYFVEGENSTDYKRYSWKVDVINSTIDSSQLPFGHPFPVGNWIYSSIGFRDTSVGYITASQALAPGLLPWGLILKTTDAGKSWVDDTVMYASGFYEIEFTDSLRGYITAEMNYDYDPTFGQWTWSNAIRYTTDGGNSWMYTYHPPVRKGWFLNDTTFLALTTYGVLFRSTLKGFKASSVVVFDQEPITDFHFLNEQNIWLLAKDGKTIYKWDPLLSVAMTEKVLPTTTTISQNYPNPAHSFTHANISLTNRSHVQIDLYDLLGRKIRTLVDTEYEEGVHTVSFDMTNIAAGLYCCQMIVNDMQESLTAISKWMSVQ